MAFDIISIGFAILSLGGLGVVGAIALFRTVNDKYPAVTFDVYDRGVKQRKTFRCWGDTIVENNIFKLLVNDFTILGDIKMMEFDMTDNPGIFGFGGGLKRIYRAYRRSDYLFAIKKDETTTVDTPQGRQVIEMTRVPPKIVVQSYDGKVNDKIKVTINKEGILVPLEILKVNEHLSEFEITNGKAIASRFVDNQKSNAVYLTASNPLVNNLLYSLPLILIVLANGIVLYLVASTVLEKLVQVTALLTSIKG